MKHFTNLFPGMKHAYGSLVDRRVVVVGDHFL